MSRTSELLLRAPDRPTVYPSIFDVDIALPMARWAACEITPREARDVRAALLGYLEREPVKSGSAWAPIRIVLGALAEDLATMAAWDDTPDTLTTAELVAPDRTGPRYAERVAAAVADLAGRRIEGRTEADAWAG